MPEIRPAAIGGKRGENKSACGKACTAESQNRWLTTGQGFETFLSSGVRFSIEYGLLMRTQVSGARIACAFGAVLGLALPVFPQGAPIFLDVEANHRVVQEMRSQTNELG